MCTKKHHKDDVDSSLNNVYQTKKEKYLYIIIPKFAGSNPAEAVGFFQGERILSTPSIGREVKPFVPCRIYTACKRFMNVTWKSGIFRRNSSDISHPSIPSFHY